MSYEIDARKLFPLADRHHAQKIGGSTEIKATATDEVRVPKKGEWFLSGATVQAYKALNDLSTPYRIARIVEVERLVIYKVVKVHFDE